MVSGIQANNGGIGKACSITGIYEIAARIRHPKRSHLTHQIDPGYGHFDGCGAGLIS
jgi:hypothetical protein